MPVRYFRLHGLPLALLAFALATASAVAAPGQPLLIPPATPTNPTPPNAAITQPLDLTLLWHGYDLDGDLTTFDVYFGTSNPPPLAASDVTSMSYTVLGLSYETVYFWKIVARANGEETAGPVWSFTTRLANYPPAAPSDPLPLDDATGVLAYASLYWTSSDPDGDDLTYDVYLGTTSPPPLVAVNHPNRAYASPGKTMSTTYYWRIVARDDDGAEVSGPEWTFTTQVNSPPNAPSSPNPSNNSINVHEPVTLDWSGSDPDYGQSLTYDVYFGADPSPSLVVSDQTTSFWNAPVLAIGTDYYWRIVARDALGLTASGPVWRFTTYSDLPPTVPSNPSPADGAQLPGKTVTLSWTSTDPESRPISFRVYFGTSPTPGLFAQTSSPQYNPGQLTYDLDYYWYIVTIDGPHVIQGPVWTFRTGPNNYPPTAPASPSPADFAIDVAQNIGLTWESTDPEGDVLTYRFYFGTTYPPPLVANDLSTNSYSVNDLSAATDHFWQVRVRDTYGNEVPGPIWQFRTSATVAAAGALPRELTLGLAHPNPFNPQTLIPYGIPSGPAVRVRVTIYDASGRPVRRLVDQNQSAGWYEATWRGDDDRGVTVASGVYYCVMQVGTERRTQKLVLLK